MPDDDGAIVTRNAPYALHVGDQRTQAESTFQPDRVFVVVLRGEPVEGPARGPAPALIEVVEAVAVAQAIETRPHGWRRDARTAVQHQHIPSGAGGKMVQRDARLHLPGFARHLRRRNQRCAQVAAGAHIAGLVHWLRHHPPHQAGQRRHRETDPAQNPSPIPFEKAHKPSPSRPE